MEITIQKDPYQSEVAPSVMNALYGLLDEDLIEEGEGTVEQLGAAVPPLYEKREGIFYLTKDGLAGSLTGHDSVPLVTPQLQEDPAFEFSRCAETVAQLGAEEALRLELGKAEGRMAQDERPRSVYGVPQSELVWQPGADGSLRPWLLSDRTHVTLGYVATDGTFKSVVTVLDAGA
jgi:hypothetical protein